MLRQRQYDIPHRLPFEQRQRLVMLAHLCNFAPAITRISHLFESQLLCWSPGCICPAFLDLRLLSGSINPIRLHQCCTILCFCTSARFRHVVCLLAQADRFALSMTRWRGLCGLRTHWDFVIGLIRRSCRLQDGLLVYSTVL